MTEKFRDMDIWDYFVGSALQGAAVRGLNGSQAANRAIKAADKIMHEREQRQHKAIMERIELEKEMDEFERQQRGEM